MTKENRVGCERPDGLLNVHSESETCEVCAVSSKQHVIDHLDEVVDSLRYRPVATTAMQMRQAADEIQRLWRERDEDIERMERAANEIERLRAALERISKHEIPIGVSKPMPAVAHDECRRIAQEVLRAQETTPRNEVFEARDLLQRIREGFNSERDESNWNIDLDAWLKRNSSPEERSGSKGPITRADAGRYWHECPHGAGYTDFPEGPCRHCWPLKTDARCPWFDGIGDDRKRCKLSADHPGTCDFGAVQETSCLFSGECKEPAYKRGLCRKHYLESVGLSENGSGD